jgi:micrococcal nuclease
MLCRHDTPVLWLSLLLVGVGAALVAVGVAWQSRSVSAFPVSPERVMTTASVTRVLTGDTIEVELDGVREQVRYLGLVAPGDGQRLETRAFLGQAALEANQQLVAGQQVQLELDIQPRDAQGRLLAYVYVGERMVNAELVQGGYVRMITMLPNVRYQARLLALQWEARAEGRGLWAQPMSALTPAAEPVPPMETLETDDPVREAQVRLKAAGFDPGPVDGKLGPRLSAALRQYQAANALPATGTLDQATLAAMGIQVSPEMPPMVARLFNPLKERQKSIEKDCTDIQTKKVEIDTVYAKAEKKHNENKEQNAADDKDLAQMIEKLPGISKNFEDAYNACNETLQYSRSSMKNMQNMVQKYSSDTGTPLTSMLDVQKLAANVLQDLIKTLTDAIQEVIQHVDMRISEYKNRQLAGGQDLENMLSKGKRL